LPGRKGGKDLSVAKKEVGHMYPGERRIRSAPETEIEKKSKGGAAETG